MMARSQAHEQNGLKKGPWTREEDQKLIEYMKRHNERGQWRDVPRLAGLNRCGKSCRLRWTNYLRPDIKRGDFSQDEEATIIHLQSVHGNKWAFISTHLPGRTDNEIKNYWNTHLKKKPLAKETPLVTQTPSQQLLATAASLASTANYLRSYALKLSSDAQLPNLHLLHNPALQGFGYVTFNPQSQLHGLGFDSTDPQDLPSTLPPQGTSFSYQAMAHPIPQLNNNHGVNFSNRSTDPAQTRPSLPPQGSSVNYEAMEDPTVHNFRDHFGPLIAKTPNTGSIPDLQVNNNHAADLGSLFGNVPHAGSIPASMVSASSEFSMTNQVEKEITPAEEISIPLSTSTTFEACWTELMDSPEFSMTNQVENEITPPAEEISIPLSTSTTFEACWSELMDSPEFSMTNQVENEITPPAEEISIPLSTSTTFEACWPELLMDSPELSMTNQVENEITPPAEEISIPLPTSTTIETWPEKLMDNETTDSFCGDIALE